MLAAPSLLQIGWRVSSVSAAPLLFDVGGNALCQMQCRVIDDEPGRPTMLLRPCGRMDSEQREGKDAGCEGHDELVHDVFRQSSRPMWLMPHRSIAPDPEKGVNIASSCCSYSRPTTSQPRIRFRLCLPHQSRRMQATRGSRRGRWGRVQFDSPVKRKGLGPAAFQIDRGLQIDLLHQTESE